MILTVYTRERFKEFFLPNINDSDHSVCLDGEFFDLDNDITLKLDIIGGVWKIYTTAEYSVTVEKRTVPSLHLEAGLTFMIKTNSGFLVPIVVAQKPRKIESEFKLDLRRKKAISIGSSEDNDIVYDESRKITRKHARIFLQDNKVYITDTSENGTYLNSKRVEETTVLKVGDIVNIFGLKIVCLGQILAISASVGKLKINCREFEYNRLFSEISSKTMTATEKTFFNRSPRLISKLFSEKIEIEEPPKLNQRGERSLLMTIGPSFTMLIPMLMSFVFMMISSNLTGAQTSPYMFIGIVTAFSSALVGVMWGIVNYRKAKKENKEEEQNRFQAYSDYLRKSADFIKEKYEYNASCLHQMYPSTQACSLYSGTSHMLWNRNSTHKDFLSHRVGTGNAPFQAEIAIPKEKFSIGYDSLSEKPKLIKEKYSIHNGVPVCIDLDSDGIIGVVGGENKKGSIDFVRNLVIQIAANNCYTDVKLCVILSEDNKYSDKLNFIKWLPHMWSEDKKERYFATDKNEASDVFYELTKILRYRDELASNSFEKKNVQKPRYILIVEDQRVLEGELISKYIFDNKAEYNLTTILLAETYEQLPNNCECIVFNNDFAKGIYTPQTMDNIGMDINFDTVTDEEAESFARRIAGVEVNEIETGGEIVSSVSFLEMYDVETVKELNVIDRWKKNRTYENMKAIIGKRVGGSNCYLDVHEKYHGPHGLVAGTTGSGKSETLQTYILSLAVNFSPDDVSFLIVDFKGGGMANLFAGLPHIAGQISNLSGNQIRRAMVSIKSENLRRQRIFSEYGVNNINNYTRLYKEREANIPIPHLFIVIDEFAELKREHGEFMSELISVAQVGRSLGVHLILATQKPAGVVDDNIRSNTKFKLCLRVQDRQDSMDVIQKADAAYLVQAGRGYFQVGNDEVFELFQSGWSGAIYDEKIIGLKTNMANMLTNTGKITLVGNRTLLKKKEEIKIAWISLVSNFVLEAAERLNVTLTELSKEDALTDLVFNIINDNAVDFADSPANRAAVLNLIKLLSVIEAEDTYKRSKAIIEIAAKTGKRLPEQKDKTQLDAVVEHLSKVASEYNYTAAGALWLPALSDNLYLSDIADNNKNDNSNWELKVNAGLCDDPTNQRQFPYEINFSKNGHAVAFGGVVSGKSTFLQTVSWGLINSYTPEELNVYALDFSNHSLQPFEKSPCFGGVMFESDIEKISKFFYMLKSMMAERRATIRAGSFSQYIKNNKGKYPAVVVIIDNYAAFKEKTDSAYEDIIHEISRDGVNFGIYLLISAGGIKMSDLPSKIADNIKTSIAFDMGEKSKYADVLKTYKIDIVPEPNIKGRGLCIINGDALEVQAALPFKAEDDYARAKAIEEKCIADSQSYKGKRARSVPEIPEKPIWEDLKTNSEFINKCEDKDLLPYAYDKENASVASLCLKESFCMLLSGAARTGKTNAMKIMMASAKMSGAKVYLIDKPDKSLSSFADVYADSYISSATELFDFCKQLMVDFRERNLVKRDMVAKGEDDHEIYERMLAYKRLVIFIADIPEFLKMAYTVDGQIGNMSGFIENIFDKGANHNIYFIGEISLEQVAAHQGKKAFQLMIGYKNGVYFGGNLSAQRMFDFSSVPFTVQNKVQKPGVGVATANHAESGARMVVVPMSKGMI